MRQIRIVDLEDIAVGAAVLGTGGGGDPYRGMWMAHVMMKERGKPVTLLDPSELADDDVVIIVGGMGAPTVGIEKLRRGDELVEAVRAVEAHIGKRSMGVMSMEAGGSNSTYPIRCASQMDLPLVDADGMGRAFPELQMLTLTIFGIPATPVAVADEKGNVVLITRAADNLWAERLARVCTVQMGGTASVAMYPLTGKQVKAAAIPGTISLCQTIGAAIRRARAEGRHPVAAAMAVMDGHRLFTGKITDVLRKTAAGFARGEARLEGLGSYAGRQCVVQFQNENLIARSGEKVLCTVPDLIIMLDAETGEPVTTEALRYGFRVEVLGVPCNWRWRLPAGLQIAGPRAFGYDLDYIPVEERVKAFAT